MRFELHGKLVRSSYL